MFFNYTNKKLKIAIFLLCLLLSILSGCSKKLTAQEIYSLNKNSVGKISTNRNTGSAFVIDKNNGLLITNYHVIEMASGISYVTENSDTYEIEGILFANDELDLAILKLNSEPLAEVVIESKQEADVGDKIFVLSSPFGGFVNTLSEGIISSIRNIEHKNYYQHTASMSEGSSGGALFNEYGNVIGITNMGVAESNVNFAIIIDNATLSIINRYKNMDITEINNNMISIKDTANREGDILNGEFTGTVKEYYDNEIPKFEGLIINGKYNGKGKTYNQRGKLTYDGDFKDGKINGKGTLYGYTRTISTSSTPAMDMSFIVYTGSFLDGKPHGYGKEYYEYDFVRDTFNAKGIDLSIAYRAGFVEFDELTNEEKKILTEHFLLVKEIKIEDLSNEFIEKYNISYIKPGLTDKGRLKYEGDYKNGLFDGFGKLYTKNGELIYEGELKNGKYHGTGTEYDINLKIKYQGKWKDGKKMEE